MSNIKFNEKTMIRNEILPLLLIFTMLLCGCGAGMTSNTTNHNNANTDEVIIRLANRSAVEMSEIEVEFGPQTAKYQRILPGKTTEYRKVAKAYSYAYIKMLVNGKKAVLQPIDYVGESLLSPGSYTYALKYNPKASSEYDRIFLTLEQD